MQMAGPYGSRSESALTSISQPPRFQGSAGSFLIAAGAAAWWLCDLAVKEWLVRKSLLGQPLLRKDSSFLHDISISFPLQNLPLPCLAEML